jgi:hypothetical protein
MYLVSVMGNPNLSALLPAALIIIVLGLYFFWFFRQSRSLLEKWAAKNGFQIVQSKLRWLAKGPYSFRSSRTQTVYRIRVRESQGRERAGWVRCGGPILGLLTGDVEVTWDAKVPNKFPEEVQGGTPCVRCEKQIAVGSKFCPFCEWTQPG